MNGSFSQTKKGRKGLARAGLPNLQYFQTIFKMLRNRVFEAATVQQPEKLYRKIFIPE
jgi:hypothetical protein